MGRLRHQGRDLRALGGLKIATIGPATARRVREFHLEPDLVPAAFDSEHLAAELVPLVRGQRILLARADRGSDVLPTVLGSVADVEQIAVYSQTDAVADPDDPAWDALRLGTIEFVTLTSSNIARAFLETADEVVRHRIHAGTVRLVTISPKTSAVVRDLGYPVAGEATTFTTDGVIEALVALAQEPTPV
jgi:uroporphyrinogen III methyltransferase/synthase